MDGGISETTVGAVTERRTGSTEEGTGSASDSDDRTSLCDDGSSAVSLQTAGLLLLPSVPSERWRPLMPEEELLLQIHCNQPRSRILTSSSLSNSVFIFLETFLSHEWNRTWFGYHGDGSGGSGKAF